MIIAKNCQCQLSVEMVTIPNGNIVNDIGVNITSYNIRHATPLCPIKRHKTTSRKQITPEYKRVLET